MRHTSKLPMDCGGVIMITYDSEKSDFEKDVAEMMLDAGDLR